MNTPGQVYLIEDHAIPINKISFLSRGEKDAAFHIRIHIGERELVFNFPSEIHRNAVWDHLVRRFDATIDSGNVK